VGAIEILSVDEVVGGFFPPAATDLISAMVAQYKQSRQRIQEVAAFAEGELCASVIGFFLDGNATEDRGRVSMQMSAKQLFDPAGAVASLNAHHWQKALDLTDVYNAMPQARRNEWNAQIRNPQGIRKHRGQEAEWETPPLPDFEEDTVRATIQGLLASRAKFLAERVDGIFRALSGVHVTNVPSAFQSRMIIANLVGSFDTLNHDRIGFIGDLRAVIAKFMGRDEPRWNSTSVVVERARRERRGQWVTLDGGALRLRAYKCGTAHLEVHPDMAWRLNCVLAHLHPLAIPPEFRARPKKVPKDFQMIGRPLPFRVIEVLEGLEQAYRLVANEGQDKWRNPYRREFVRNGLQFRYGVTADKAIRAEAERVIAYLGGVKSPNDRGGEIYEFDYPPHEAIAEVIATGCLPDQKAYQYYPTPDPIAEAVVQAAMEDATDQTSWLEPSGGTGALADRLPQASTVVVEISALHCTVLRAKGHQVVQADFLKWAPAAPFDRIVANPPFSEGRWQAHLEHAATMLAPGGRLHFVLPASAKGKEVLPGWICEWSRVFESEFAGTSVDVVLLTAQRA
jgi:hypothetical protein